MSARDRLVLLGLGAVAILAAMWMLVVSPARKQASQASVEVASARTQLAQAQSEVAQAQSAQQRYRKAYASLSSLGMAVPTSQEVPSLMYSLDHAANHHKVVFSSITNGGSSSSSATPSSTAGTASSSAAAAPIAPFSQVPFTFVFTGGYGDLVKLLSNLEAFTVQTSAGALRVSGRLLTIQSIQLATGAGSGPANANEMSWSISASAYVLAPPPSTTGPTPPTAGAPGTATPTSTGGSSGVGTPAVVKVGG
jgi:Type II secretion system (T2SS), protein M